MFQITRVHVDGLGPNAARLDPLTVRFDDETGMPVDSVFWLMNGGGKGVFLKTLFSVIRPDKVKEIGAERTEGTDFRGDITQLIGARDIGHVIIEWLGENDVRLVTGTVLAWPGGVVKDTASDLSRYWYSFTPQSGFGFDEAVSGCRGDRDGRAFRTPIREYVDGLRERARVNPHLNVAIVEGSVKKWLEHENRLGIDSELYAYQARMNRDESGVEKVFRFRNHIDFIKLFLETTTDDSHVAQIADNIALITEKVRQLPEKQRELEFAAGARERLTALAEAEAARQEAEGERRSAELSARSLARGLASRAAAEERRSVELNDEVDRHEARRAEQRRLRTVAGDRVRRFERVACELTHRDNEVALASADADHVRAELEREAWKAAEFVAELSGLQARVQEMQAAADEFEHETAPLRERRDQAALAYAAKLTAERDRAGSAEQEAHDRARQANELSDQLAERLREIAGERAEATTRRGELDRLAGAYEQAIEALRAAGTVGREEAAADALQRVRDEFAQAAARLDEITASLVSLAARREQLDGQMATARQTLTGANSERSQLVSEHDRLVTERDSIAAEQRVIDLYEGQDLDLALVAGELVARLLDEIASAERALVADEAARYEDNRALRALTDGDLLPPSRDLEQALEVLAAAGIAATSGWQYLSGMDETERERLLTTRPELAGSVVVTQPDKFTYATERLADADLNPRSVVLVSEPEQLFASGDSTASVVPPDPALYDQDEAARRRSTLEQQMEEAKEHRAELEERIAGDRRLATRLEQFLAGSPFERITHIAQRVRELDSLIEQTSEKLERAAGEQREIAGEQASLQQEEKGLHVRQTSLVRVEEQLKALAADEDQQVARQSEIAALTATLGKLAGEVSHCEEKLASARAEHSDAGSVAAEMRAVRERLGLALAALSVEDGAARAAGEPEGSVEELRASWESLNALVQESLSSSEALRALEQAKARLAPVQARLRQFAEEVVALAWQLLATPAGADETSRRESLSRAEQQAMRTGADRLLAEDACTQSRRALELYHGQPALAAEQDDPDTAAAATAAKEQAERERDAISAAENEATELRDQAKRELDLVRRRAGQFREWSEQLEEQLPEEVLAPFPGEQPASPFAGDEEEGLRVRKQTGERLRATGSRLESARSKVRVYFDQVRAFTADARFQTLASTMIFQRLAQDAESVLAGRAATFAAEITTRAQVLEREINDLDRHKDTAVTQLMHVVEDSLKDIERLTRLSKLPDGLGAWSGKEFIRIRYAKPSSEAELRARLAVVVDDVAQGRVKLGDQTARNGLPLLLAALAAAVGGNGFVVSFLKPESDAESGERILATEASGKSSGGQGATLAILLYCTLSRLRAEKRGAQTVRSTLVLDNPFGKATARYLVDKQRAVAAAAGVQLIYTTGINDHGAIRLFPNLQRLRNDKDISRNVRHLRIDAEETVPEAARTGAGHLLVAGLVEKQ